MVIAIKDHSITKGHRGQREQYLAFYADPPRTQLPWPNGKHNKYPSTAMDVLTYPYPDSEQEIREEQLYLLGLYRAVAHMLGYKLRTGADWDRDGDISDNGFDDFFHVELDKED